MCKGASFVWLLTKKPQDARMQKRFKLQYEYSNAAIRQLRTDAYLLQI